MCRSLSRSRLGCRLSVDSCHASSPLRLTFLPLVLLLGGCGDLLGDFEEIDPTLGVFPRRITVVEGRAAEVALRCNMSLVVWGMGYGSTDERVAWVDTVDIAGDHTALAQIRGIGPGSTDIHFGVNAAGDHASATLTVTVKGVSARALTLDPDSLQVVPGTGFWIVPHAKDSVGWELVDQPIEWQISDTSALYLEDRSYWYRSGGVPPGSAWFRAQKPGVVTITASLEGLHSSSVINVTEPMPSGSGSN